MLHYQLIASFFRDTWLIDPAYAETVYPYVLDMLEGKNSPLKLSNDEKITPYCLGDDAIVVGRLGSDATSDTGSGLFDAAPSGSTAVLPIRDAITKYDGFCNTGVETYMRWMDEADASPNIKQICLLLDSPGGQANASFMLAARVAASPKRVLAFVDAGMAASGGYLVGCAADLFYVSTPVDMLGSIGAMVRIADYSARLREDSPKVWEIYSRLSSEKNGSYRRLRENNDPSLVQDMLDEAAGQFIEAVKQYRGDRLNLTAGDPFKGATYTAANALKMGLIDGVASLPDALAKLSAYTKPSIQSNNNNPMSLKQKLMALLSSEEETIETTAEETATESTVTETSGTVETTVETTVPQLTIEQRLAKLEADQAAELAAKDKQIADLQAKLALKPAAEATKPVKTTTEAAPEVSDSGELSILSETDAEVARLRATMRSKRPGNKA